MRRQRERVGELRPSQLLFSFGIGSIVDLPHISAMVMGLEDWPMAYADAIAEERLLAAVREEVGNQVEKLCHPPLPPETAGPSRGLDAGTRIGVPVGAFPQWLRCPFCNLVAPLTSGVFEPRFNPYRPEQARFIHINCKKPGAPPVAVPARFLVACERGHLDDFPWLEFLHGGATGCKGPLRLVKLGVSAEAADLVLQCDTCGARQSLANAFGEKGAESLPRCRGRRPHLRDFEECEEAARAILLGASNSWFAIALTALSIPAEGGRLAQLVEENWPVLRAATSREIVAAFRQVGNLKAFADCSDDELWRAIQEHRARQEGGPDEAVGDLRTPEWRVFSRADPRRNSKDFQLREVASPSGFEGVFDKVVLVERLREVRALIGFTRIESPNDYAEVGDIPEENRAPISRQPPRWVPAAEVRGEGVFLAVNDELLRRWLATPAVRAREEEFRAAHRRWRELRRIADIDAGFPGMRYILLHSLAHALMRQMALSSGYGAASLRERIYAADDGDGGPMAGILVYTAAPDSEGTLGGLVGLGNPERLGRLLAEALEEMRLCASDPLCAEHHPHREGVSLHGAACHACLFAPETSCERGNKYLDRTLLAQTFDHAWPPFLALGAAA